jgi:Fe-S cluster biogenesis protein NfuA
MLARLKEALKGFARRNSSDGLATVEAPCEPNASSAVAPPASTERITLQHVWTAEANAVKLRVSRMLMPLGETRNYPEVGAATDSPLAQALFELPGVTAVSLDSASVQVTLADDADWDALVDRIPGVITRHLEMGLAAVEGLAATSDGSAQAKRYSFGFRQIPETTRTPEEQRRIVQALLDDEINPAVAAHGGYFNLIAVEHNNVYVQLGGGCQGCGMVDVTLRQGVEQRIRQVLPEMNELIDVTNHGAGSNPYYQPGK